MNKLFYPKLAFMNLKKNHKTYAPYLFTCILTIMLFYALSAIGMNNGLEQIRGGTAIGTVMEWVTALTGGFSVIFLFYTNSFLIKQRKKELGLYQVMGMDKKNLSLMMLWETLITAAVSLGAGLLLGLALGKLMFLIFLKVVHFPVPLDFAVEPEALLKTARLFLAVFLINLAWNLFRVARSAISELAGASRAGEREPRGKWLLAVFGLASLGGGYYIAQTADSPLTAVNVFFFAVILVIIGTYLLFMSGSIVLLKALKKKKTYYYKIKHFTAVSGMLYRMKQNAVRLIQETAKEAGVKVKGELGYRSFLLPCMLKGDAAMFGNAVTYGDEEGFTESYRGMVLIPLEDYNAVTGENATLQEGEALVYAPEDEYAYDTILLGDVPYTVKEVLENAPLIAEGMMSHVVGMFYVILPDVSSVEYLAKEYGFSSEELNHVGYDAWFDMEGDAQDKEEMVRRLEESIVQENPDSIVQYKEDYRESTYVMNGGALFIGIFAGALFLISTVLIIYYKQISEGYDDRENYQIMQKVGMDRREVRRTIRSQILAVFFLPLLGAFLHVAFAFRVMTMLLEVMYVLNVPLFLKCTAGVTAVFTLFYVIVYMVTSREYYRIVR